MKELMRVFAILIVSQSVSIAQATDTLFWRGVYLFGRDSVDTEQMSDTLGLNLIQYSSGYYPSHDPPILNNPGGLRVVNQRKLLSTHSKSQRMEFEAEQSADPFRNYLRTEKPGWILVTKEDVWSVVIRLDGW